jgi:hypothetical protein
MCVEQQIAPFQHRPWQKKKICVCLSRKLVGADAGDEARVSRRVLLNLVGLEFLVR